jgi:hypothetical protein
MLINSFGIHKLLLNVLARGNRRAAPIFQYAPTSLDTYPFLVKVRETMRLQPVTCTLFSRPVLLPVALRNSCITGYTV